jgi:hypothetical protein
MLNPTMKASHKFSENLFAQPLTIAPGPNPRAVAKFRSHTGTVRMSIWGGISCPPEFGAALPAHASPARGTNRTQSAVIEGAADRGRGNRLRHATLKRKPGLLAPGRDGPGLSPVAPISPVHKTANSMPPSSESSPIAAPRLPPGLSFRASATPWPPPSTARADRDCFLPPASP